MKIKTALFYLSFFTLLSCKNITPIGYKSISKAELHDKIKGAWTGKMIGVMHGIGMEFQAVGTMFTDSIAWTPKMIEGALREKMTSTVN